MDFYNDSNNYAGLSLTPEEKSAYAILFAKAEPNSNGLITPNQAFNFLTKSKLPNEILSKIWQLTQNNSSLNREGFYKALKYIALAQNNQPINPRLLYTSTPLPIFEGIYINNNKPNVSSGQDINSLTISDNEYERWSNLFYQSKPVNNNIDGNTAKDIFLKSGLSTNVLAEVWQLVDLEQSGELDLNEFLIAMFIIMRLKDNSIREIPRAIPSNLWKSVAYNKKSVNYRAQRLSTISTNNDSFSSSFTSPVTLNRTGGSNIPVNVNVTGGNQIPLNVTGGSMNMPNNSININKTGGSVVSVNRTGSNMMLTSPHGYNSFNSSSMLTNQNSTQSFNSNYSNDYAISQQERDKYDQLFNNLDMMGNQYITGEQSMNFFLKSGLPTPELAQIWELADMSKVGRLSREEFYIAMHLIRQRKSGMKLPTTLPECLIAPSLRKNNANSNANANANANANNLAITSSNFNSSNSITGSNSQLANSFNNSQKVENDLLGSFETSSNTNNEVMNFNSIRSTGNAVENEVNQLKNEIQQMDNSILSMTNEKQLMKSQRDQLEQELTNLVSKKNELSMKQAQLKISFDSESRILNDLRVTFAKENQSREAAQAECNELEEVVKKLKSEKMFVEHDIERSKEEVNQLNNRIKELKTEYTTLKEEVDRLTAEQKHQNDILNVTRQMTMDEQQKVEQLKQDKMNLQKSIQNNQKEIDRAANENSFIKQDSKTINPFEKGENNFFSNPPSSKPEPMNSFDDAFDALSARATTKFSQSEKFDNSFNDAFGTPNPSNAGQVNAFDEAFQTPNVKSAQPVDNSNVFDDAFQVSNNNGNDTKPNNGENKFENSFANDDPFKSQNVSASFEEAFGDSNSKNNFEPQKKSSLRHPFPVNDSLLENPFASSTNLSSMAMPVADGFDDAFKVSNDGKKPVLNSNLNSFDDAFGSNINTPLSTNNGFEDDFNTNTKNKNSENKPSESNNFGTDFNNAFTNSNTITDPFNNSEGPSSNVSPTEKQDLAGFNFQSSQYPNQDIAGFSFDNGFNPNNINANGTPNILPNGDSFQVASPKTAEPVNDKQNEANGENDSSSDEDVEEIENPFGDDQIIEEDSYLKEEGEGKQSIYPMPQPVSNTQEINQNTISEQQENTIPGTQDIPTPNLIQNKQENTEPVPIQELPSQNSVPMPMPMPQVVQETFEEHTLVSEQQQQEQKLEQEQDQQEQQLEQDQDHQEQQLDQDQEHQDQQLEQDQEQQEQQQQEQEQPEQQEQEQEQEQQEQQQQQEEEEEEQEQQQEQEQHEQEQQEQEQQEQQQEQEQQEQEQQEQQQQEQEQEQQEQEQQEQEQQEQQQQQTSNIVKDENVDTELENPFESEGNIISNENAFETNFNDAFQNMSISNEPSMPIPKVAQEPININPKEINDGNVVKSVSNNSIKINEINELDIDKEFQVFEKNSSPFDKVDTSNGTSNLVQDVIDENAISSSFDEEFKQGFDDNDFNFDTTFKNSTANINKDNSANSFDAFAEQAANNANFDTNFDNAFSNQANDSINSTNPQFDTNFDNPFSNQSNNSTAQFDTKFDDPFSNQGNSNVAQFDTKFDDAFNFEGFSNNNNNYERKPSNEIMDEAFGVSNLSPTNNENVNDFGNSPFGNNFNDNFNNSDPFANSNTPVTSNDNPIPDANKE